MSAHAPPRKRIISDRLTAVGSAKRLTFNKSQCVGTAKIRHRKIERLERERNGLRYVAAIIATIEMIEVVAAFGDWDGRWQLTFMTVVNMVAVTVFVVFAMTRNMLARSLMLVSASIVAKSVVHTAPERHVYHDGKACDFYQ